MHGNVSHRPHYVYNCTCYLKKNTVYNPNVNKIIFLSGFYFLGHGSCDKALNKDSFGCFVFFCEGIAIFESGLDFQLNLKVDFPMADEWLPSTKSFF